MEASNIFDVYLQKINHVMIMICGNSLKARPGTEPGKLEMVLSNSMCIFHMQLAKCSSLLVRNVFYH